MTIVLDTFPASSVAKLPARTPTEADRCREWIDRCADAGHVILVPAIAYYEALRELELRQASGQIARLQAYCRRPTRFLPLSTEDLELAARLWAASRRGDKPTSSPHALDADVILAAQALNLGLASTDYVVATSNPAHLSRFVPCDLWSNIAPPA
jgi:predicted nucleic acid-binding protein